MGRLYPFAKQDFLSGNLSVLDTLKIILLDTSLYTYNGSHRYLSSVPTGARIATSTTWTGVTVSGGTVDGPDKAIDDVVGPPVEAILVYRDTGVEGTSNLIALFEAPTDFDAFAPDGGQVTLTWDNGAAKVFTI